MKRIGVSIFALSLLLPFVSSAQSVCPSASLGNRGATVSAIQKILYDAYADFPTPTGYFGILTEAAVKQWQKDNGIISSGSPATTGWGTVGPKTARAMGLCPVAAPEAPPAASLAIEALKAELLRLISILNEILKIRGLAPVPTPSFETRGIEVNLPAVEPATPVIPQLPSVPVLPPVPIVPPEVPTVPAIRSCILTDGSTATTLQAMLASGCTTIETAANARVRLSSPSTIHIPVHVSLGTGAQWDLSSETRVVLGGGYTIPLERTPYFTGAGRIESATSTRSVDTSGSCGIDAPRIAYPEWFGAKAGDATDDSVAINKALQLGNDVVLATGIYDQVNRIMLEDHQTLRGASKKQTFIRQSKNPSINTDLTAPIFKRIGRSDFIVGLGGDCTALSDLTIDASAFPRSPTGFLMIGIKVGFALDGFNNTPTPTRPPIKNITIRNVQIVKPEFNCIYIGTARGIHGVMIDGVDCTMRGFGETLQSAAGLSTAGFGYPYPYQQKDITVRNSIFRGGGTWVMYLAGAENFRIEDSQLILDNSACPTPDLAGCGLTVLKAYTGDIADPLTLTIKNSTLKFINPKRPSTTLHVEMPSVINIIGGGHWSHNPTYAPFIVDKSGERVRTSLRIEGSTLEATGTGAENTALIRDLINFSEPIVITSSTLKGGGYGILAASSTNPQAFGGVRGYYGSAGYVLGRPELWPLCQPTAGRLSTAHIMCDFSAEDLANTTLKIRHSDFDVSQTTFTGQAFAPYLINEHGSIRVNGIVPTNAE